MTPTISHNNSLVCQGIEIISCDVALVNWISITSSDNIMLPTGEVLNFDFTLEPYHNINHGMTIIFEVWKVNIFYIALEVRDHHSSIYKNSKGSSGVLTYTKQTLYGNFELSSGQDFKIESLNGLTHVVWAEVDQSVWKDELSPLAIEPDTEILPHMRMEELLAKGRADTETIVEFSITVYYTKEFKAATADPKTFIEQVITETNQGYINSEVPIRAKLHCAVESDISDGLDASTTLEQFKRSQYNLNRVRKSADATILLVNQYSSSGVCGVNYFNTISSGNTVGTVRKGCALGYYSFGHEVAHGFGLAHDRRVASYSSTDYAYGNVIKVSIIHLALLTIKCLTKSHFFFRKDFIVQ